MHPLGVRPHEVLVLIYPNLQRCSSKTRDIEWVMQWIHDSNTVACAQLCSGSMQLGQIPTRPRAWRVWAIERDPGLTATRILFPWICDNMYQNACQKLLTGAFQFHTLELPHLALGNPIQSYNILHAYLHEMIALKSCFLIEKRLCRRILRPSMPWRRRSLMPWLMSITFPWFWIKLPLAIQTSMVIHRMLPLVFKFSTRAMLQVDWYQMVTFSKGIILKTSGRPIGLIFPFLRSSHSAVV